MTKPRRRAAPGPSSTPLGLDIDDVTRAVGQGRRVRRRLHPGGRLHIDRALPFLCVFRQPAGPPDARSEALVTTQASYLVAPGGAEFARELTHLVTSLVDGLVKDFGACLLIEVSVQEEAALPSDGERPFFRIVTGRDGEPAETVAELETSLSRILPVDADDATGVEVERRANPSPRGSTPILKRHGSQPGFSVIGLEIRPVYADSERDRQYPLVHRRLRRDLAGALKRAAFEFTTRHTTQRPSHYHALGRGKFVKAVWEVDRRLAEVSNRFDFLLLSTPRNTDAAWAEFRRSGFERAPRFSYPPLPFDPALAKRELYAVPIERIEDPNLEDLFEEQQEELDRKITMLADRGTPSFRYGSLQLYGGVEDELLHQAEELLQRVPSRSREPGKGASLDARAFAARAKAELEHLGGGSHPLPAKVRIRRDIGGLMVSRGHLLVPSKASIPAARVDALLQHEVGTHILTYYNGAAQPFRQLRNGLPGYDELQEGLAVLAEYLVGGLSRARLRILAARVVAVRRMIDGASFVDVFHELDRDFDFAQRTAFTTTMRVFRGGGQAKDAVYYRGLASLLAHLASGGSLEPILVGKIGLQHLELVGDLQARGVLVPPPFRPRYLEHPEAQARLEALRKGARVIDLATTERRSKRRR